MLTPGSTGWNTQPRTRAGTGAGGPGLGAPRQTRPPASAGPAHARPARRAPPERVVRPAPPSRPCPPPALPRPRPPPPGAPARHRVQRVRKAAPDPARTALGEAALQPLAHSPRTEAWDLEQDGRRRGRVLLRPPGRAGRRGAGAGGGRGRGRRGLAAAPPAQPGAAAVPPAAGPGLQRPACAELAAPPGCRGRHAPPCCAGAWGGVALELCWVQSCVVSPWLSPFWGRGRAGRRTWRMS